MPKEIWKISQFHGGVDNFSDGRDIDQECSSLIKGLVVDSFGKLRMPPEINASTTLTTSFNSASFSMTFKGQSETQVTTMLAHARRGEVNYSNNPTFLENGQSRVFLTSSHIYEENKDLKLKNFVSSSEPHYSASFERQVFVSRVAVYDRNKNLIGIATLANPVLKKEAEDVSFKIKFDI